MLHAAAAGNIVSDRRFRYGDPDAPLPRPRTHRHHRRLPAQLLHADRILGVLAQYFPADDVYEVLANFMGPFALHAGDGAGAEGAGQPAAPNTPPDSGGSFGVRQAVFPYVVLMSVAARAAAGRSNGSRTGSSISSPRPRRPTASPRSRRRSAPTARSRRSAGTSSRIAAPYPRARAGDALSHARQYDRRLRLRHVAMRNRVVLTNKTPTGLVRGFGGPQVYFALERLMQRIAVELDLDPLEVIRRNLVPAGCLSLSLPGRRAARFRRFRARARARVGRWRPRRAAARGASGARARAASTASALPRWSSPRSPTWATSPRC